MAAPSGFEPLLTGSEPVVLPATPWGSRSRVGPSPIRFAGTGQARSSPCIFQVIPAGPVREIGGDFIKVLRKGWDDKPIERYPILRTPPGAF